MSDIATLHHPATLDNFYTKLNGWEESTKIKKPNEGRCGKCWLRTYDCYCEDFGVVRNKIKELTSLQKGGSQQAAEPNDNELYESNGSIVSVRISACMYYHYSEIGRSANTAHVLEAILEKHHQEDMPLECTSLVFGDSVAEADIVEQMKPINQRIDEINGNEEIICACVMYPSQDSITLSEYVDKLVADVRAGVAYQDAPLRLHLRLVMLDGTYPCSRRQLKHLRKCCAQPRRGYPLPVVKLHLDEFGCKSAITGLMYQPGRDKLCTYQACVLAIRQIVEHVNQLRSPLPPPLPQEPLPPNDGARSTAAAVCLPKPPHEYLHLCDFLLKELDFWIEHILKSRIKFGKPKPKFANKEVLHFTPNAAIVKLLKTNPPPSGQLKWKEEIITSSSVSSDSGGMYVSGVAVLKHGVIDVIKTKRFSALSYLVRKKKS